MSEIEWDMAAVLDAFDVEYRDKDGEQSIRCPIHEDRVASCSLNLGKGLFHCHACAANGDAIDLIKQRELVDYEAAVIRYQSITGTSNKDLRKRDDSSKPRRPSSPGAGYKPRFYRKLPAGLRKRTDFGA